MAYKYYKSDFALILNVGANYLDSSSTVRVLDTDKNFYLRFYSPLTGSVADAYVASSVDGTLTNCAILSKSQVIVYFDMAQHQFAVGDLMLEAEFVIADNRYEGDHEYNIIRLYNTGIKLTDRPDLDTEGQMTVDIYELVLDELVRSKAEQTVLAAINPKIKEFDDFLKAEQLKLLHIGPVVSEEDEIDDSVWST